MSLGSMTLAIRATAEGVKEGVSVATAELRKLEAEKKKAKEDLDVKIKTSGVEALKKDLKELEQQKEKLSVERKLRIDSTEVENLRVQLSSLEDKRKRISEQLKVSVDAGEISALNGQLVEIEKQKKEIRSQIKIEVAAEADAAKKDISDLNKKIYEVKDKITVAVETAGIGKAETDIQSLEIQMRAAQKSAGEMERQYPKLAASGAAAFGAIALAVKSAVSTYTEVLEAQTKLNHLMRQNLDANSENVDGIIRLTKEYEQYGVISANVQQAGAQELSTYLSQVNSLKKLLPVLNDIVAQQKGYNAAAGDAVSIATMLGKVMEGEVGSLKRYGFSFDEAQEQILKFGTEAERVAMLVDVIGASVGGTNEALRQTDAGAITALRTEAENTAEIFGESLTPTIAAVAEQLTKIVSATNDFASRNNSAVAGVTASVSVYTALVAILAIAKTAIIAKTKANSAYVAVTATATGATASFAAALSTLSVVALPIATIIGAVVLVTNEIKKSEDQQRQLNEAITEYNELMAQGATDDTIERFRVNIDAAKELTDELIKMAEAANITGESLGNIAPWERTNRIKDATADLAIKAAQLGISLQGASGHMKTFEQLLSEVAEAEADNAEKVERYNKALQLREAYEKAAAKAAVDYNDLIKEQVSNFNKLKSAYDSVSKGEKLSAEQVMELVKNHGELAKHIANTADWQTNLKAKMEEVIEIERQMSVKSIQSQMDIETATINSAKSQIRAHESTIASMGYTGQAVALLNEQLGVQQKIVVEAEERYAQLLAQIAVLNADLGGSSSKRAVSVKKETNELLEKEKKLLEDTLALTEMTTQAQIEGWQKVKTFARKPEEEVEIDKKVYALRRQLNDEWYEEEIAAITRLNRGRMDATDYQGITDKLRVVLDEATALYGEDYPLRLQAIQEQINGLMSSTAENLANKLLSIETQSVDDRLAEQERYIQKYKLMAGTMIDGEEFAFGAEQEARYVEEQLRINEERIKRLASLERELTDAEFSELEKRLDARITYQQKLEDLAITAVKEQQTADQKATEALKKELERRKSEQDKYAQDRLSAMKKASEDEIKVIKARYTDEIDLTKQASDAEVNIINDRIKAIDALLKADARADTEADEQEQLRRLKERLSYETSDTNIYELQKQITNTEAEIQRRKRRETLEDEKAAAQEQISIIKDNYAKQKEALEALRDAEIEAQQKTLDAYSQRLDTESRMLTEKLSKDTDTITHEEDTRLANNKKFLSDVHAQDVKASQEKRVLFSQATDGIISDLYSRVNSFYQAGRRLGDAFFTGYQETVAALASAAMAASSGASTSGASAANANTYQVDIQQNFNTPVSSPSQVSRETQYVLEDMLKYLG